MNIYDAVIIDEDDICTEEHEYFPDYDEEITEPQITMTLDELKALVSVLQTAMGMPTAFSPDEDTTAELEAYFIK